MQRRVFIVGGALTPFIGKGHPDFVHKKHPDFGKRENPTLEEYITTATNDALKNTGTAAEQVDRLSVGNFTGELFSKQGHLGAALVGANKGFMNKPSMRVEGACASGALAVQTVVESLLGGTSEVAMAVGAEVQNTVSAREGGDFLARASHYARQRSIDDFTFPALFARRMKAIAAANHFTMDDTARVAANSYAKANLNELAHMKKIKMTYENASTASDKNPCFLGNAEFRDFLRVTDCSQVSDGGAAMVLASEEGLKRLGKSPSDCVEIVGLYTATGNLYEDSDPLRMSTSAAAAQKALAMAGVKPSELGVAEVHDCFTIAEILMYEALGIADFGKGKDLVREGATTLEGRIPVNTGGGLVGFGHPVGATGVKQLMEVFRQMKGQCGAYQLKTQPALGACLNMGGDDKTAVCTVLKNL